MKTLRAVLAILCLAILPRHASAFAGADPFDFLYMESGARQSALGGAFAAGRNDANAIAYNPAGLAFMERTHLSFMHTGHFQGVNREHIAIAVPAGIGLSVDYIKFGSLGRTTLSEPAGTGDSFSPTAYVATLGFGMRLTENWAAGVNGKRIHQEIDGTAASSWAADAGLQVDVLQEPRVILGLSVQNLGTKTKFQSSEEGTPLNIRAGSAIRLQIAEIPIGLLVDINKASERDVIINAGIGATLWERLEIRVGYNTRSDTGLGLSFGFGLVHKNYSFDYALVPSGVLGVSNQISLGVRWGK